ncbi:MAG: ATP-dependent helicase, partial [Verrucomicrobiota bacterium]
QDYRFKLEPSNRKWWLRDRHHVLNFLGRHWGNLEDVWGADFTDNFHQRTQVIKDARISTEVSEEKNGYKVFLSIKAGGASDQEINQSHNSGKSYI